MMLIRSQIPARVRIPSLSNARRHDEVFTPSFFTCSLPADGSTACFVALALQSCKSLKTTRPMTQRPTIGVPFCAALRSLALRQYSKASSTSCAPCSWQHESQSLSDAGTLLAVLKLEFHEMLRDLNSYIKCLLRGHAFRSNISLPAGGRGDCSLFLPIPNCFLRASGSPPTE